MKVLVITGSYPPDKCGVGDYTYHLAKSLSAFNHLELAILTSTYPTDEYHIESVKILHNKHGWRLRNLFKIKKLISEFNPDVAHIQYPTIGYTGIIAKYLPVLCKMMGIKVIQTWHEHYAGCGTIGWPNVISCDGLIYVRPDLPVLLPTWVKYWLRSIPQMYVPNAATIPIPALNENDILIIKQKISKDKKIVCFFGFANQNKGLENLFKIVNPETQHLVLICDLDIRNPYQEEILNIIKQEKWVKHVTVTGFLPSQEVGKILAASDAIIFPFPDGTGVWNTSLKAAENSGVFTIATTKQPELLGYQKDRNIYYLACDDINSMGEVLDHYIGNRIMLNTSYSWEDVSRSHHQFYQKLLKQH